MDWADKKATSGEFTGAGATWTKATVNEIHISGQGIILQLVRAFIIHYDGVTSCEITFPLVKKNYIVLHISPKNRQYFSYNQFIVH